MSTNNTNQTKYGRRTWNRELYAALARDEQDKQDLGGLQEGQLTEDGKRLLKQRYTDRNKLLSDSLNDLNKKVIARNVSSFKRGKQFGFYCELCDMTFKDTLQYVDHLNHKLHAIRFEDILGEPLILNSRDNDDVELGEFEKVLSSVVDEFVAEHAERVSKTGYKSRKRKGGGGSGGRDAAAMSANSELAKVMGFSSFGSKRKK